MRRLLLFATLALAAACGPSRQDLEVDWTFDGGSCQAAGVALIQIDLAGEVLNPNQFRCVDGTRLNTGAYLGTYLVGGYDLTVTGFDAASAVLYKKSARIEVKKGAANKVAIDLTSSSATLRWSFDGKTCAQAGVTSVTASVDGHALADVNNNSDLPCSQGGVDGITVSPLTEGAHSFNLTAYVGNHAAYVLAAPLTVTIVQGQNTAASPNLAVAAPTGGTANLYWSFAGMTCAQARVDTVSIAYDPKADGTGGADSGTVPCANAGVEGAVVEEVPPGTHSFAITATRHTAAGDKLVYASTASVAGPFQVGKTTDLALTGEALSPMKGGVQLNWTFPAGGPACSAGSPAVTYTLTDPALHALAQTTSPCSGVDDCFTHAGDPACPGLTPGIWTVTASAASGGNTYAATKVKFAVPNNDHAQATIVLQ